jgi:arsenate reductase-like glutaredoxin family protein
MSEFDLANWQQRELKSENVSESELNEMHRFTQSYEALFSKKSTQIKERNIDVQSLQEEDFKRLILEHYSFLKRPVFITDKEIFVGNDKNNVENLRTYFKK